MDRVSSLESPLSVQEQRIARLLAWGMIQKEIADRMKISPATISVHLRNIYRKLSIHKETDLCRWWIFYEYGIADNPLKKIIAFLFLVMSITMILEESYSVRTFPCRTMRPVARTLKPARTRKYLNVLSFKLQYC